MTTTKPAHQQFVDGIDYGDHRGIYADETPAESAIRGMGEGETFLAAAARTGAHPDDITALAELT